MLFIFKAGILSLNFYYLFPSTTVYVCEDILPMAFRVKVILQFSLCSLYLLFWWLRCACTWVLFEKHMWYFLVLISPILLDLSCRSKFWPSVWLFFSISHKKLLDVFWILEDLRKNCWSSCPIPYDCLSQPCFSGFGMCSFILLSL